MERQPNTRDPRFPAAYWRYSLAVAAALVAVLLRWLLNPILGERIPYLTIYPAMMIVAVTLGTWPALLNAILGLILIELFFVEPFGGIEATASFGVRGLILLLTSLYVGRVGEKLRSARFRAEAEAAAVRQAEAALRQSEARHRSFIEVTGQLGWITNAAGEVVEDLPAWRKYTGQSEEALKGWGWSAALHPDDLAETTRLWRKAVATQGHYEVEYRLRRHDGLYRHFLARGMPVFKKDGGFQEWVGTCIDITERKQVEASLQKENREVGLSNRILREFVEERGDDLFVAVLDIVLEETASRHGVFGYIPEPGHLICPSLSKMFDECEIEGKCIHYPPEKWKGLWARALLEKRSLFTNQGAKVPLGHVPIHNNLAVPILFQGEAIGLWNLANKEAGYTEEDRELLEAMASRIAPVLYAWIQQKLRDDERRQAEENLKQAHDELEIRVEERTVELGKTVNLLEAERKRFYDLLETLPAYLVLLTPDYQVPFANRFFRERFGEANGLRCFEYLFGRSEPCEVCETYTVLKTGAPHRWEWAGPDGRLYDVYDYPFHEQDGSTLILEMGIDVTERKQAEAELKQSENRVRFFASQCLTAQEDERKRIAGELHDSLASMLVAVKFRIEKTTAQIEKEAGSAGSFRDILAIVGAAIQEVRRIMADLRPAVLDDLGLIPALNWLCREFEKTYSHIRVEKRLELSESDVTQMLKTAIFRLSQEALNNIANHSQASQVSLTLHKANGKIILVIEDNGQGFVPGKVVRGLGLSTMKERTELSGGNYRLESSRGKGTAITASWSLGGAE